MAGGVIFAPQAHVPFRIFVHRREIVSMLSQVSGSQRSDVVRRTTFEDLEHLLGVEARSDVALLSGHVADAADDVELIEHLAAAICALPAPNLSIVQLLERSHDTPAAIEVFRRVLAGLGLTHPLGGSVMPALDVLAAYDLRRTGGSLRFQTRTSAVRPGLPVVAIDMANPLTGWRVCVVEEVVSTGQGTVVHLRRLLEHDTAITDRALEPPALIVALSGDVAELVSKAGKGRVASEDLLSDPDFSCGFGERTSVWTPHGAANLKPLFKIAPIVSIAGTTPAPGVVALHQLARSHVSAGGYHFGVRWRCVSGAAVMALRVMAVGPMREEILAQISAMVTPDDGWVAIDQTIPSDNLDTVRFEVGVLNLVAGVAVEISEPFLQTFNGLWQANDLGMT